MRKSIWFNTLAVAFAISPILLSAEPDPIVQRIDQLLLQKMQAAEVQPSDRSDDAEFLRRLSLDLAGRIPTVAQAREFLDNESENKRTQLIDQLLNSPATVNHLAEHWRNAMLPSNASPETFRNSAGLHNWLRGADQQQHAL